MKIKDKIINLAQNRRILIAVIILGIIAKLFLYPIRLGDYNVYLEPWVNFIKQNGYFSALEHDFYNYTPAYIYILVLIAKTGIYPLYLIKAVSMLFEFVLAFYIGKIAQLKYKNKSIVLLSLAVVPLLPTIILNGAFWGQCDSIYSAFAIGAFYYMLRSKPLASVVMLGLAFSFKMQFVFILPLFFVFLLRGHIKWYYFLIVPIIYFISIIPAWAYGRDLTDLLTIYISQSNYEKSLTVFFSNIYVWFDNEHFYLIKNLGYAFVFVVTLATGLMLRNKKYIFTLDTWVNLAFLSVIIAPFLLPGMRERYLYLGDAMAFLYFLFYRRNYYLTIGILSVSFYFYLACSRLQTILILEPVFFIYLLLIILAVIDYVKQLAENTKTESDLQQ